MRLRRDKRERSVFQLQDDGRLGSARDKKAPEPFRVYERGDGNMRMHSTLSRALPGRRFRIGGIIAISLVMILFARAAHLQIIEQAYYREKADTNRIREQTIPAPRGIIYDRNGTILAENIPSFVLTMTMSGLPDDDDERSRVLSRAADLAGLQPTDFDLLITRYASSPHDPIPVKRGMGYESAMRLAIATSELPGIGLEASTRRSYDTGAVSLSHVLGYTGKLNQAEYEQKVREGYRPIDRIGKAGIEKGAEPILRGVPGKHVVEVDARGRELAVVADEPAVPGGNITLSIDAGLQRFIESRMRAAFEASGASRGAVVAIDPRTGSVRALASLPSYDSNAFANGIDPDFLQALSEDPDNPLFPRAIAGEFPSGSVFKPFVAYAALKEGVVSEHASFVSRGGISIGPWFFPDWRPGGHGVTDVRKAIYDSVNTYFYIIGGGFDTITGLGVRRIGEYARKFGFGQRSGIELPGEADGFLPSKEWKREAKGEPWYVGDTYHLAIGQGDLLVTPLQMAVATAMVANGGSPVRPSLIEGVDGYYPAGWQTKRAAPEMEPVDNRLLEIVRQGMRQTVTIGTARSLSVLSEPVAGKTGTAQTPGDRPTHAWFTAFGPYENPSLAVAVLIEEGGEGSTIAAPIAREIFGWWFQNVQ